MIPASDDWDDQPLRVLPVAGEGAVIQTGRGDDGGRVAAVVPSSVGRLRAAQLEPYRDLQRLALEAERLRDEIRAAVEECRDVGVSWAAVAFAVGMSDEGARKRFAPRELD